MAKIRKSTSLSSSANEVAFSEELLTHIFLYLPPKSLIRCKCVSKHWHNIITSPHFTRLTTPRFNPARGLFLHCSCFLIKPSHEFVSFSLEYQIPAPLPRLTFLDHPSRIRMLQSCNGLLLCCSFRGLEPKRNYYIYNPTTRQYITLSKPVGHRQVSKVVLGMNLAFDPWKWSHYKVVCIRKSELAPEHYQIEIYSSEAKRWRVSGPPFRARYDIPLAYGGVYWNGAIYWLGGENSLRFNIEQENLDKFPMPCTDQSLDNEGRDAYFGESCGHLHLVQVYSRRKLTFYNIYEMKSDGTEWFLKYQVNVQQVVNEFPHMVRHYLEPTDWHYLAMAVLCIVRGEKEEDAFMILHIPRMMIRFNLRDYTFYKLCEFGNSRTDDENQFEEARATPVNLEFDRSISAFQYEQSLFCL